MRHAALLAAAALLTACGGGGDQAATNTAEPITPIAAPNGGDWTQMVTQTPEGGMLMGNPNAPVKVVEFASMTCPACAAFSTQDESKLVDQYVKTGRVSFEFRNFVRDPLDITMALIARCAGANPTFFKLTDGMFADQKAIFERVQAAPQAELQQLASLPPAQQFQRYAQLAGLQEWAAQRGLPSGRTSQCLANQAETERLVQMNSDAASQYQIPGTPSFLVNNELVKGDASQSNWQSLEAAIRGALG